MNSEVLTKTQDIINGVFNKEEAKDVLLSMIDFKIQFHHKKLLHHFDTSGEALFASDERINELKEMRKDLVSLIEKNEEASFLIKSNLEVQVL